MPWNVTPRRHDGNAVWPATGAWPGRPGHDRDLLTALGIDLDEVLRRVLDATSTRLDDPSPWQLHRSRVRPLRITLSGPAAEIADASSESVHILRRGKVDLRRLWTDLQHRHRSG